ncbi:MAG: mechanosensitive ion channel family protein [Chloroflexota bacterium]
MIDQIPLLNDLPPGLREFVARLLLAVLIVILIVVLRRIVTWILLTPLRRLAKTTGFQKDDAIIDVMAQPIRLIVVAFAILIGLEILGVGDSLDVFIANVARTLVILALLAALYKFIDLLAPSSIQLTRVTGLSIEERLLPFIRTGAKLVIIAVGAVIIIQEWGYDVSGLIAGFGLGGLAFSLAAQDTVSNLFGFMAIVSDSPFDVGEYIIMSEAEGLVEHVGLRTTRIRRPDQAIIYVPNSTMANSAITNWSRLQKRRMDYVLGVTYDTRSGDIRVLLHRIREMLRQQELVEPDSVVVYFLGFGDSALNILVRCHVLLSDWGEFHAEQERLNLLVMDIVDELGMSIAFPSMSLYVENLPPVDTPDRSPERDLEPRLNAVERALKSGRIDQAPEPPKPPTGTADENVTGQQDEGED